MAEGIVAKFNEMWEKNIFAVNPTSTIGDAAEQKTVIGALKKMPIPKEACKFDLCWDPFDDDETVPFDKKCSKEEGKEIYLAHFHYVVIANDDDFKTFTSRLIEHFPNLCFLSLNITGMSSSIDATREKFIESIAYLTNFVPNIWIVLDGATKMRMSGLEEWKMNNYENFYQEFFSQQASRSSVIIENCLAGIIKGEKVSNQIFFSDSTKGKKVVVRFW